MRAMKPRQYALAACLASCALATSASEPASAEVCGAYSQAEMRDCLVNEAKASEAALAHAEHGALDALSRWDEDERYIRTAKAQLAKANTAFPAYRSAQCAYAGSLSGGGAGNAHEIRSLVCIADMNRTRAAQLRESTSRLPVK